MFMQPGRGGKFVVLFIFFLFHRIPLFSFAWWDEGHMILAAIARLELSSDDVAALEGTLNLWRNEYPGMSTLPVAAVWPDHIKCTTAEEFCQGLDFLDAVELFNPWHFVNLPYNPQNISLATPYDALPWPMTGAPWALRAIFSSLTGITQSDLYNRPNRHIKREEACSDQPQSSTNFTFPILLTRGSTFSWNLQLRLLIHIFGDLHQPLHAIETFSTAFPRGDFGGKKVVIKNGTVSDLHQLWDSCGGQLTGSWPIVSFHTVVKKAQAIRQQFPRTFFGRRLQSSVLFEDIAQDSHNVAKRVVYNDTVFHWERNSSHLLFEPNPEYYQKTKEICLEQLALGGYRLTTILRLIAPHAKEFLSRAQASQMMDSYTDFHNVAQYVQGSNTINKENEKKENSLSLPAPVWDTVWVKVLLIFSLAFNLASAVLLWLQRHRTTSCDPMASTMKYCEIEPPPYELLQNV